MKKAVQSLVIASVLLAAQSALASRVAPISVHLDGIYAASANLLLKEDVEPALEEAITKACGNSEVSDVSVTTKVKTMVDGTDTASVEIRGTVTCRE